MITKPYEPSTLRLFQYVVASADMYYAEQEQRDVFLGRDDAGHIRIWGQTANGGPSTRIGLCRVFLEYGLYCSSWCSRAEANYHMQNFGDRLGHRLAKYLQANPALLAPDDPTVPRARAGIRGHRRRLFGGPHRGGSAVPTHILPSGRRGETLRFAIC